MAEIQDVIQDVIDLPDTTTALGGPNDEPGLQQLPRLTPEQVSSQLSLLLQSMLDVLPDDTVIAIRRFLVRGDHQSAVATLVFACLRFGVRLSNVEHAVLAECLHTVDGDPSYFTYLAVGDEARPLVFAFLPTSASSGPDDAIDPAVGPEARQRHADVDAAVVARFASDSVLGIWRAWRRPVTGAPWPQPRAIYLVEVADQPAADSVMDLHYGPSAPALGDDDPLVEAYVSGLDLPALLRAVQFAGELVHLGSERHDFVFSDVFEGSPGPDGSPQRIVQVSDDEAEAMLDYLMSGTPLMMADVDGDDVIDRSLTEVVPLHLRTDGHWIWSDASAYYLERHRIAPPPEFRAFLTGRAPLGRQVQDVVLHQAAAWLEQADGS